MDGLNIRDFRWEDLDEVIELWRSAGLSHRPEGRDAPDKLKAEYQSETAVFLVGEVDGRIVAVVFGTQDGRKGWVNRLAVRPEFQKQGVGEAMVLALEERFRSLELEFFAAHIEDWNNGSMEFARKLGYVEHRDIIYFSKKLRDDV